MKLTNRITPPAGVATIALALALMAPSTVAGLDLSQGPEILSSIDELSTFEGDLAAVMTFVSEDPETGVERQVVQQFRRDEGDMFLMLVQEPATKLGQGYLLIDDNLWFYDPESRNFSHTSMKEEFADSDARNSDFGASSLNEDYEAVSISEGRLGRYDVYILELEARHNEVTYPSEILWVTRDLYLPLKTEDYSGTGRLMRTSLFPSYARAGDNYIATNIIFIDELVEGKKTQITITDISVEPLADYIFTKAYVERVNR